MENECSWYDPSCTLKWLQEEMQAFSLWLYDGLLTGLAKIFESIPVPDFLMNIQTITIPPVVAWAAEPLNIPFGIGVVVSAYTFRFILRRIPFIG